MKATVRQIFKYIIDSLLLIECQFQKKEPHDKKRVLILRKDALGDLIIFIPFIKYIKKHYDAELSLVVHSTATDLIPTFSNEVDNIIEFNSKKFSTNFFYRRQFFLKLKRKGFDTVIYPVFTRESMGDLMVKITNAHEKIGSADARNKNNKIYSRLIETDSTLNELERNKQFVEKLTGNSIEIKFPTIDKSLLSDNEYLRLTKEYDLPYKKYCVLFPGAGAVYRIWQKEKFAEVCDFISTHGYKVVICGSKSEVTLGEKISSLCKNKKDILLLSGKTNLASLTHLLANSAFYFGSETGILHLACTLDIPTVAIVGGGHLGRFYPYGDIHIHRQAYDESAPCKNDAWACSRNLSVGQIAPCIENISVEKAKAELLEVIKILNP